MENLAKDLILRFGVLKAARDGYWLQVWREVRQYVMPTYSDYLCEGGVRGDLIFDSTAIEARKRLAAGIYNWMAPPDKRWFELVPQEDELAKDEEVKDYFSEVTKRVAFAMANSNWSTVLIQVLNNLACGLDGIVYCEDGGEDALVNFRSFPVETICYSENSKGFVDTVFRETEWTARQILQEFGRDGNIPEKYHQEAGDPQKCDQKHKTVRRISNVRSFLFGILRTQSTRARPSHSFTGGTSSRRATVTAISLMDTSSSSHPGVNRGPQKHTGMVISSGRSVPWLLS